MKRKGKILLGIGAALVLIVVFALIALATFDWNRAKPWLADNIGQALGRTVAIDGDVHVSWQRDPDIHGWLPGPHLALAKVSIGNTDWAKSRTFATMKATELSLDLFPLLAHTLSIPSMHVIAPDVHLERLADGRDNWTFAAADASSPWKLDLGRIQFDQGDVAIVDGKNGLDAKIHVDALSKSIAFDDIVAEQEASSQRDATARVGASGARGLAQNANKAVEPAQRSRETSQFYAFGLTIEGTLKKAPLRGTGKVGDAWALKHVDRPFPLHADLHIGDTRIAFAGTLIDPADLDALDLRLWLSGNNLSDLYNILKVTLPNSPPYATEGHLVGRFTHDVKKLRYENFRARIGSSDLSGDLLYETKAPRPLLSGKVQSELLQFRDLAPLIGANSGDTPPGKVLPERPFQPQRWQRMDADVQFTGDRVFRDSELPIHKLDTRIVMDNALLTLDPLRFKFAYGDVESSLRFDGRTAPIKGSLKLTARDVQVERLIPKAQSAQASLGHANGEATLEARGNSVAALLGASSGELKLVLDGGTLSKALIETMGLNMPNILAVKLFGDKQVTINCAAADFVATAGVYDSRLFLLDTDIATINVTGKINLASEQLDLVVHPDSKGLRLLSLRSPIHVQGTFGQPDVGVDKRALLLRGLGAAALGVVAAPVAALLPLTATNLGKDDENGCAALLKQVQQPAGAKRPRK